MRRPVSSRTHSPILRFRPYPAYKNPGVECLGEIPAGWEVKRLKHTTSKIGSGKTPSGGAEVYVSDGIMLLRSQNVHFSGLRLDDVAFIDAKTDSEMSGSRVQEGDVLLNITGASLGRCCIARLGGVAANVNQHVCIIRPGESLFDPLFLTNAVASSSVQAQIFNNEDGISRDALNFEQIGELVVGRPPIAEQRAIAGFLDRVTTRIDALVAKKERLIELLQEKRTALISRAVTKGLDPNVPMKDSGVEWLERIPVHWTTKHLRWAIMFQRGHDLPTEEREDGKVPVVSSSGISSVHSRATAKAPGIVTGRYGTIGHFHLVMQDYWPLNTTLYSIDLRGNDPRFLRYMLTHLSPLFLLNAVKSAVPGVDRNDIHPIRTAVAPLREQGAIADFLDARSTEIDSLIAKVRSAIDRLKELRIALISAAVTGKIDVRGENA